MIGVFFAIVAALVVFSILRFLIRTLALPFAIIILIAIAASGCAPPTPVVYNETGCSGGRGIPVRDMIRACYAAANARHREENEAKQREYVQSSAEYERQKQAERAIASHAQSVASPELLRYEAHLNSVYTALGKAIAIQDCGLRSDLWLGTFQAAADQSIISDQTNLSDNERAAAISYGHEKLNLGIKSVSCESIINSPEIEELDRIQYRISGGYH